MRPFCVDHADWRLGLLHKLVEIDDRHICLVLAPMILTEFTSLPHNHVVELVELHWELNAGRSSQLIKKGETLTEEQTLLSLHHLLVLIDFNLWLPLSIYANLRMLLRLLTRFRFGFLN